jgi:hypothetical protein
MGLGKPASNARNAAAPQSAVLHDKPRQSPRVMSCFAVCT